MKKLRTSALILLSCVVVGSGAIVSGCTSYATPEQLQRISALEREISSLEQSIQQKQGVIGGIDRQISAQEAKLDQCAKDKDLVRQRLANWKGN
jgi:outer membrane murein-binding lipoprotein Lpp